MDKPLTKHVEIVCTYLRIDQDELGRIISEDPSWFTQETQGGTAYLKIDNSPFHKESEKRYQLELLAEHLEKLSHLLETDDDVIIFLHRSRKKLRGASFVDIAKKSASPLPEYNGLQDLIDHIQKWFRRKNID